MKELPQFRELLHQRRDDALRRVEVGQGVGHHERLEPGERIERDARDQLPVQLLDVDAAVAAQRQGRGAKARAVGDGEVDLALGRHRALEGDAVGLGGEVAGAVLDEIEPLFLFQGSLEIGGAAEQAGLALLAHAALEDRLDEDRSVAADQRLDLVLARRRAEDLRRGMAREPGELPDGTAPGLGIAAARARRMPADEGHRGRADRSLHQRAARPRTPAARGCPRVSGPCTAASGA